MNILVTGGAGYIGSHTCVALHEAGHSIVILDNLTNSKHETINRIEKITKKNVPFYEIDITNTEEFFKVFEKHKIDGVIHFAGFKAVGESVQKPLDYYYNNLLSTINLAQACKKFAVNKFVFSSSATVYGANSVPFKESAKLLPTTNPYGETKAMCERILIDWAKSNSENQISLLRYFNPIGAHESGLIGEEPNGFPNNIMPYVTQVAMGKHEKIRIFGNDYPTPDGTGVRDYIHVMDLAEGHVAALNHLSNGVRIYNLGTGQGTSVLELIKAFENVNNVKIPFEIVERRPGDIAICYAEVSKAKNELKWIAKRDINTMCKDAWNFEKNKNNI